MAYAVFPAGDSVWVGTSRGILIALPGERDLVRPSTLASASLQAPVVALGSLGDTLVGLTRDQMLWRDPRTEAWTAGPNLSAVLGGFRNFTPDGAGFWVAGDAAWLRAPRHATDATAACAATFPAPRTTLRWTTISSGWRPMPVWSVPPRRRATVSGEFERIAEDREALVPRAGRHRSTTARCSAGNGQLVGEHRTSVEGVHFRLDWIGHREVGWRAAAAALSDLAAEGAARPRSWPR